MHCKGRITLAANGEFSYGRRAFEHGDLVGFTVNIPRNLGAYDVRLKLFDEHSGQEYFYSLDWENERLGEDEFYTEIDSKIFSGGVLLFFGIELQSIIGHLYARKDGCGSTIRFDMAIGDIPLDMQMSFSNFKYKAPSWISGGTIYHIFVDRFYRHKLDYVREDAILNEDWDNGIPQYPAYPGAPLENNMFFGGTLYGIIEKLDYISSLGVNCIYLSPIFEAYSNHKYDTGNYMKVDEMFGGDKALDELIEKANEYGISIILDGVFNHTGADSIYFNKYGRYDNIGAYQSKASPYYSWFDFQSFPDEYTSWWGIKILPRINTAVKECGDYFVGDGGMIEHYSRKGIAGFRLDVVDELTDKFVSDIKSSLNRDNKSSILYGEVWEDASNKIAYDVRKKYYLGSELDGVMNYPFRTGIIEFIRNKSTAPLVFALLEVLPNMPKRIADIQMNFLGTHDTERIITALAGDSFNGISNDVLAHKRMSPSQRKTGVKRLKAAYTLLATLPGVPSIFYGDEVGLEGYKDPFNRMPYPWKSQDFELLEFFKEVGKLRRENTVYKDGEFSLIALDSKFIAFSREKGKSKYITVINNCEEKIEISVNKPIKTLFGKSNVKNIVILLGEEYSVFRVSKDAEVVFE